VPGAAEPVRSFELSHTGWGAGSTASSQALARAGDVDKAAAATARSHDRHELSDLWARVPLKAWIF
jgi:hypothetical protein